MSAVEVSANQRACREKEEVERGPEIPERDAHALQCRGESITAWQGRTEHDRRGHRCASGQRFQNPSRKGSTARVTDQVRLATSVCGLPGHNLLSNFRRAESIASPGPQMIGEQRPESGGPIVNLNAAFESTIVEALSDAPIQGAAALDTWQNYCEILGSSCAVAQLAESTEPPTS